MRWIVPVVSLVAAGPAWGEPHTVTVVNSGTETIRRIEIGPAGGGGENRLRSQVPPGAQARITYSTGCTADVRIGYDSGRFEAFAGVDVCSDPRIASGQGVLAGPSPSTSAGSGKSSSQASGLGKGLSTPTASSSKAPPPVVPPWTGKSITKRFGGMD